MMMTLCNDDDDDDDDDMMIEVKECASSASFRCRQVVITHSNNKSL